MTYPRNCEESNTKSSTSGTSNGNPCGGFEFIPDFSGICGTQTFFFLLYCFVDHCLSLAFEHLTIALSCSFSNSGFWLLLLVSSNFSFFYFQNKQTMSFLRGIGSNTSINCFALNLKNGQQVNPDVDICSKLNSEMYLRLSSFDNRRTCKRIPLLLARSYVDEEKYGICVVQLKNALGVSITVGRINSMRY